MRKSWLLWGGAVGLLIAATAGSLWAAETDTILVRGKFGLNMYSMTDYGESGAGLGLDLDWRNANGFSLGVATKLLLSASDIRFLGGSNSQTTTVEGRLFQIMPGFSVSKGMATLQFGLGLGVLSTDVAVSTSASSGSAKTSLSRFAVSPTFNLDLELIPHFLATLGLQYVLPVGEQPRLNFFSVMTGIGVLF